jgi:hypothetical protein
MWGLVAEITGKKVKVVGTPGFVKCSEKIFVELPVIRDSRGGLGTQGRDGRGRVRRRLGGRR